MARIYKRGKVWYSDLFISGKRVRVPLHRDKIEAQKKLAGKLEEQAAARYGTPLLNASWEDFKGKFKVYSGAKAPTTHLTDLRAIKSLEKHSPRPLLKATDLKPETLELWKAARKKAGMKPSSINRELGALKAMRAKAVEWGYIPVSPLKVKAFREPKKVPLYFTEYQFGVLRARAAKAGRLWETAAMLGTYAGLRPGEIYHLPRSAILREAKVVRVEATDHFTPKDYEVRDIPICKPLWDHLKELPQTEYVLGERPDFATFLSFFRKITREVHLTGSLKTCRATFASWLVQRGVPIFTVSKLLGHSTMTHTLKYAALNQKSFEEAVSLLK